MNCFDSARLSASARWIFARSFARRPAHRAGLSHRVVRGVGRWLLGLAVMAVPLSARAQTTPSVTEELFVRIAALEAENARLAEQIRTLPSAQESQYTAWQEPALTQADIQAEVERYLQQREAQEAQQELIAESAAAGYEVGSDLNMSASWNHGLELSSPNQDFRVHVGGRTQFDTAWFSVDEDVQSNINVPYQDGVDFRRARLRIDGSMYEVIEWAAEYDFVNAIRFRNAADTGTVDSAVTGITDLWWTIKSLPVLGNVRIGNQKEPIGFEHLVSSRFLPFMERSYNQDSFYGGAFNGFTPGIQAFNAYDDEWGTWAIGLFKPTDNVFAVNATDGDYAVTGRVTRLLWYEHEGAELLHVGLSARQATTVNDRTRFRARDAVRAGLASFWPIPADTGTLAGDDMQWINTELAAVYGPWTLQGEYLVSFLQEAQIPGPPAGPVVDQVDYHGGYIQLLYFLTGEHDHYRRAGGFFERVTPRENFFRVSTADGPQTGSGAWQIGARYNYLDLNDGLIQGGILHNGTLGINWFLNPNMKIQMNYIATYRDAPLAADLGDGWIHGWGIRVAHDF
jgi:phosphate-selective porin OprO/OprP